MQRNKKIASRLFFSFGVMTVMISPYLERPVRTLDRVLEDRVLKDGGLEAGGLEAGGLEAGGLEAGGLVPPEAPRPASAAPVGLPVGSNPDSDARRLDPTGVLVRLLMSGHGAEGGDEGGNEGGNERTPVEAPAEVPAASRPSGRRAA